MALKPDRTHIDSQIDYFMNEVAERGGIVCVSTAASGAGMDNSSALCTYAAQPSGCKALGVLMSEMVNLDLTRQHMNFHKEEVQQGGKVTIWSKGTVVTDRIYPGQTPAGGDNAWVGHSGFISNSDVATDDADTVSRIVGRFLTAKDEDGFAKVSINVP
jgi:hypothetical protein